MSGKKETKGSNIFGFLKTWEGWQGKKKNSFLLILLLLGVLLMFAGSFFKSASPKPTPEYSQIEYQDNFPDNNIQENYEKELTGELTDILEQMEGVSNVRVLITYEKSEEAVYAQVTEESRKETTEKDTEGGTRDIIETTMKEEYVLLQEGGGGERALLLMENKPKVEGVLVVAKGAENAELRLKMLRAIQSLMGLPAHRIAVLPWGAPDEK